MKKQLFRIFLSLFLFLGAGLPGLQAQQTLQNRLDSIILPEVEFDDLELNKVAYVLSSFSRIYGDNRTEIKIRAQKDELRIFNAPVRIKARNKSLLTILERIADQTNCELDFRQDGSVFFSKRKSAASIQPYGANRLLTLKQKAAQIRELNPNWNTHLRDYDLVLAYVEYYPNQLDTFIVPPTMRAELRAKQDKATSEAATTHTNAITTQNTASLAEQNRLARERLEQRFQAQETYRNEQAAKANDQNATNVIQKMNSDRKENNELGVIVLIILGIVVAGSIAYSLGQDSSANEYKAGQHTPPKKKKYSAATPVKQPSTAAPAKTKATAKTPAKKKISTAKPAKKRAPTTAPAKKKTSATASGGAKAKAVKKAQSSSHESGGMTEIEAQIAQLRKMVDAGRITEEEMDQRIREILTG